MKRMLSLLMSLFILAASFSFPVSAFALKTTDVKKTRIGTSDTYYEYSAAGKTLTFSGSGAIPNMINNESSQPWFLWRSDGSIENVVFEEGITSIGNYVLYQVCAENVSLPSTLTRIGNYALAYNSEILSLELPFGVQSIGASAFENCSAMKSVNLPTSLVSISKNAFKQCYALEEVEIPYSVESIGSYAFYRCSQLSSVIFQTLSSSVSIGSYAFKTCPKLLQLSVPLNATMGVYSFGYNESNQKYSDISMKLYSGSDAMAYAKSRSIPYTLLDVIPLEVGVINKNEYIEETTLYTYKYSFTPKVTQIYNIYSTGEVDTKAVLSDETGDLLEADDIGKDNLNFCLTYEFEAGKEYIITVSSVKSIGDYSVVVYPDEITSFDIKGCLNFSADEGELADNSTRYFEINDEMIEGFILSINFAGNFQSKMYYQSGYFDNKEIALSDNQNENPFTCGDNSSYILIGNTQSAFNVFIEHSYSEEVIVPTVDDDGYSVFTCILCDDSYKDNFVPTTAVTISGSAVLMENPNGTHPHNIPYSSATFYANNRTYYIDENGNWSVNTFDDLDLVFENENGEDVNVHIDVDGENVEYGVIAFMGYDFNKDGNVNAKDFVIFLKQKKETLGENYWDFAYNFF